MTRFGTLVAGLVLSGALAMVACGGDDRGAGQPGGQPTQTTTPPGTPPAQP